MRPAGFWRRYAAYSLDVLAVLVLASPLLVPRLMVAWRALDAGIGALQMRLWELFDESVAAAGLALPDPLALARQWADDPVLRDGIGVLAAVLLTTTAVATGLVVAAAALWFIGFEASPLRATPGKRLLGLRVAGLDGGRAPAWRIALRFAAGAPSWFFLHIGHAMAGWNRERRALHDFIAGTRVLLAEGAPEAMPRWAVSWLLLQGAAVSGLLAWVVHQYAQAALVLAG